MQRPRLLGWVLGSSLLAAACAHAAEPAPQTQYSSPPPELLTNDIGQLERDLDQNEQVILAELGPPSGAPAGQRKAESEAPSPSSAAGATADEKERAPARAAPQVAPAAPASAPAPCGDACRAFGSMQRSAGRICELTGSDQERCTRARERVRAAETRISQAGCVCAPRSD